MVLNKDTRTIVYSGEINEELASEFVSNFLILDQLNSPISIICASSYGGEVEPALAMIDCIRNSQNEISFYGSGIQGSCQALIFLAADKKYFTSETVHFLFHKGTAAFEMDMQSNRDMKAFKKTAEALDFQNEWDYKWISENSIKPPAYWKERMEKESEVYIFAEDALELELIDAIKGYN